MKYIIKILNRLLPKELPKPVGRWSNEYCDKKISKRVDLSNEDHCGPCGQYNIIEKEKEITDTLNKK